MREREVARFERAGDVRSISVVEGADGALEVRERREGPSALIAYGEDERSLRALFAPASASDLPRVLGGVTPAEYLSDEKNDLVDLMDLCDAQGVAYEFVSVGPRSGVEFRPAV